MIKRTLAVAAGKAAATASRRFRFGGGSALPGLVAERIDPELVPALAASLGQGSVLVTGTNGKTTTARLLGRIARAAGFAVVANRTGSNMMRGIASALLGAAGWSGEIESAAKRLGIFEVDEATLPHAIEAVRPRAVLFTNLLRDQLDRYGEVEHVAHVWKAALESMPSSVAVVLNADDPSVASLAGSARGPLVTYGVKDTSSGVGALEHAADARWCLVCGEELTYDAVSYAHIGHWRCPSCGSRRQEPDVQCGRLDMTADQLDVTIWLPRGQVKARLPLTGLYNAYNVLAATAAAVALDIDREAIERGLNSFTVAFGRQERMRVAGRKVQVILAKNPAGLNQVIRAITSNGTQADIVLFLNDKIADGRDVSWIWDVDFELLAGKTGSVTVSGTRAWDLALRLKYAGLVTNVATSQVEPRTALALKQALEATPSGGTLYVIPTYTAMLEVRDLLARWAGRGSFWEGD